MRCTPVFGLKLKPWDAAGGVIDMQFHALINPIAAGFLFFLVLPESHWI